MDEDWDGWSCEDLDAIERNAATLLARKRLLSTAPAQFPLGSHAPSPQKIQLPAEPSNFSTASMPSINAIRDSTPQRHQLQMSQDFISLRKNGGESAWTWSSPSKTPGRAIPLKITKEQGGRIAVETQYNAHLVNALKNVAGRLWDSVRKVWTYPEAGLEEVVKAVTSLSHLKLKVCVEPPLSVRGGLVQECAAGNADFQEEDFEVFSTPPKPIPPENRDGFRSPSISPKLSQPLSSQDGASTPVPRKYCKVKFFLHSCGKIAARHDYDQQLVAAFRIIPRSEYYHTERLWMFPFSSLTEAEKILRNISDRHVTIEPLEPLVKRALDATSALPDLQERFELVAGKLKSQLMPFQTAGVRFALQHGGRALIADEMGLGKTLQALAVVSCLKDDWPVLIIVPSSLRVHWAKMLVQWVEVDPSDITIVMSQGSCRDGFNIERSTGKRRVQIDGLFNIVSYDMLSKLEVVIKNNCFKIVIADESHYMKNPQAKRTNVCVPLLQKAKYAFLLTGTPALSRPIELYKQLEALQPHVYQSIHEYGNRYCQGGYFGQWQGACNKEELHALVKSTIMIRRLKKDVLKYLPRKRREQVIISLDDHGSKQIRVLMIELEDTKKAIRTAIQLGDQEEIDNLNMTERQLLAKIYSESAEVKIPAVQEYLETMIEGGCKFLVFAHHQTMLNGIQELLEKKKVKFIRIDGKTPSGLRADLVGKFQTDEKIMAAVLGIRAAGVGLTLTAASTVIFAEMTWTPGDLVQAEDRAHRIGQASSVNVYYLHAHDTIDDLIWDTVRHKLETLGQVIDGQDDKSMEVGPSPIKNHAEISQVQPSLHAYMKPCGNAPENGSGQSQAAPLNLSDYEPSTNTNAMCLPNVLAKRKRELFSNKLEETLKVGQVVDLTDSPLRS